MASQRAFGEEVGGETRQTSEKHERPSKRPVFMDGNEKARNRGWGSVL